MKRIIKLFILVIMLIMFGHISIRETYAKADSDTSDYRRFSSMQLSSGKLLKNYSSTDLKKHLNSCNKRKLSGWRISYMNKHVRCNFTSKTLLCIYNDGTSPITYKLSETQTSMYKTSISGTGSLTGSAKGDVKKFKGGLDGKLGIEGSYTKTIDVKTSESLEIQVDPGTKATIYLKGSGYLTTGCAVYYSMFIRELTGCFEYFEIIDCYPKIVKEKI